MRTMHEIDMELQKEQEKLAMLTSKAPEELEYRNGDVYSAIRSTNTVGSNDEISRTRKRIMELNEEKRTRQAWENTAPKREEERQKQVEAMESYEKRKIAEQKNYEKNVEMRRLETFKRVKQQYKAMGKKHKFERIINKLQGKSPNWKKIQEYSQEQLNYLSKVQQGEALSQKKRGIITKDSRQKNWDDFVAKANSKYKINQGIEYEEKYHYGM